MSDVDWDQISDVLGLVILVGLFVGVSFMVLLMLGAWIMRKITTWLAGRK